MEATVQLRYALDTFYLLISGALVMWMAAGFAMLEAGLVRAKNTAEILTKNILLYAIACVLFMGVGYGIMYPAGGNGLIPQIDWGFMLGGDHKLEDLLAGGEEAPVFARMADFFFQVVFVATAMSIVSGAVAERMKLWAFLLFALVMTGFIYEPKKPYTIQQWMENLGSKFDADRWVQDFQEAGASYVIFYDKWIDGLVFHDTQTTNFKTKRDFLRELAAACQRGGLPLVIYFNAISDGNPEFDEWALLDRDGQPIVFGAAWPTRYQTLHSPFRQKCLEQARELLSNYGPIHGIWFDIFHERFHTTSPWTARGYQQMFGEPFETATGPRLAEFQARTLAGYLDQVAAIRREQRQEQCLFTANGSGSAFIGGGPWTEQVGSRLQYLYNEGHSFQNNEKLARMAWALPKPLDINLLLVSSWFTPLEDAPPPASLSVEQAIAATAISVLLMISIAR